MPVLTLKHPFDLNGKRYEALTLRRATGGMMRLLDRSGALGLISKMQEDLLRHQKAGMTDEQAAAAALPAGLLDKLGPFFAKAASLDEAVIDELDAEDFMALFEKLGEVLPEDPLAKRPATTS